MSDSGDWREDAFDVYRVAWSEILERWRGHQDHDVENIVEELKEALLDLKQATIADDEALAEQYVDEVVTLLIELRFRRKDD